MKLSEAVYGKLLEKDFEKALSLSNRYSFINANIFPLLSKEEKDLLIEFQGHCQNLAKDGQAMRDDVYPMFPKLGEHHMIQRFNPYDGIEGCTKHQMLLSLASVQMGPEFDMAVVASGILGGNALFHNPKRTEIQEKALADVYRGKAVAAIGITEPERGSDAVNMLMDAKVNPDGTITYNGSKIYTTNGSVADYIAAYGVTDISDPRHSMMLTLFKGDDKGLKKERLNIPAARGVGIAKCSYENITVPADRMIAPPGEGYKRLFRGLTGERICIISSSIAGIWGALANGVLYTQVRTQFGKPLFSYQGISHVLGDLYARAAAYTAFAFQMADFYDKKIASKIHHGETPSPIDEGSAAVMAAQGKYLTARMSHEAAYEVVQLMGGRGAIDEPDSNNGACRGENLSRISEVVGGHRNIQLQIIEMGLRGTSAMAIGQAAEKSVRNLKKEGEKITEIVAGKAEKMIAENGDKMGPENKANLSGILAKLKAAKEGSNKVELEAYSKALPKAFAEASKAIYKANKGPDAKED